MNILPPLFKGARIPGPARIDIHALAYAGLDQRVEAACVRMLDPEEARRHGAFLFPHNRREYAAARALAKHALASLLGEAASSLKIESATFAKPRLSGSRPEASGIDFNITHGGGFAAIGIAVGGLVGIDVEPLDRAIDFGAIVPSFFSESEAAELENVPESRRRERFFTIWTLKEAYLKALGVGLSGWGPGFSFALTGAGHARIAGPGVQRPAGMAWHFRTRLLESGHVLSVAGLFPIGTPPAFSLNVIPPDRFGSMLLDPSPALPAPCPSPSLYPEVPRSGYPKQGRISGPMDNITVHL